MREFDPDEVARLETAMWRSYYEKHRARLFNEMTELLRHAGGDLVGYYAAEDDLAAAYQQRIPDARRLRSEAEILENPSVQLVASAAISDERGPLGIRAMRVGVRYSVCAIWQATIFTSSLLVRAMRMSVSAIPAASSTEG